MLTDAELLNMIRQNAQMGVFGINRIINMPGNPELHKALVEQREEYIHIYREADRALTHMNYPPQDIGSMAKLGSAMATMMKTTQDGSDSKLAEMMVQGNTMGEVKLLRKLSHYEGSSENVMHMADRMLETQRRNSEQMKSFL